MPSKPIEIRISQPNPIVAGEAGDEPTVPRYGGPAIFSYGFRPFFLSAALLAGVIVPLWVLLFAGMIGPSFLYPPREWHVHEMLFGFLPAVITGFLLTAIPNWTGRPPLRGIPLMSLWTLWLAGRLLLLAVPWVAPIVVAIVDGAFLVVLAAIVWRELAAGRRWSQAPVGIVISLLAVANIWFHVMALRGAPTDFPERMGLALIMLLLTVIGGRITPNFTREFMVQADLAPLPASFSRFDGLSILLVVVAVLAWLVQPESVATGTAFLAAGSVNLIRLWRWRGWGARREPLVMMLHVGYGWLALSFFALGVAILGIGLSQVNAVHALTTGAVGAMTLAVMTRATLGHTGRPKQVGPLTIVMYGLVVIGAMLRVIVPASTAPTVTAQVLLGLSALVWSGAYLLFVFIYGPFLLRPSLDE